MNKTLWGSRIDSGAGALDIVMLDIPIGQEFTIDQIKNEVIRRSLLLRGAINEHLNRRRREGFVVKTTNGWKRV